MLTDYARRWWMVALTGLLALVFGITALVWPQLTLQSLVVVFGVFALIDGILALVMGIAARGWVPALAGIAGIIFGVLTIAWPNISGLVLLYLIAAWAVITGTLEILATIELRRMIGGDWLLIIDGALSIVFGLLLVAFPGPGAIGLVWLIGAYAIVSGILLTLLALDMHDWIRAVEKLEKSAFEGVA
jgi:uncharacterized membrane protein HdeD (DUF308 family)